MTTAAQTAKSTRATIVREATTTEAPPLIYLGQDTTPEPIVLIPGTSTAAPSEDIDCPYFAYSVFFDSPPIRHCTFPFYGSTAALNTTLREFYSFGCLL